jgi:alpha-galactosidase
MATSSLWWSSIASIIDQASFNYWSTDFYGRNDLDIMEVGNTSKGTPIGNLTYEESKSHFTAWALLKSPLIIGTDLTNTSNPYLKANIEILKNKDLIKINQDPYWARPSLLSAGAPPQPDYVSNPSHPAQYWSGNSS